MALSGLAQRYCFHDSRLRSGRPDTRGSVWPGPYRGLHDRASPVKSRSCLDSLTRGKRLCTNIRLSYFDMIDNSAPGHSTPHLLHDTYVCSIYKLRTMADSEVSSSLAHDRLAGPLTWDFSGIGLLPWWVIGQHVSVSSLFVWMLRNCRSFMWRNGSPMFATVNVDSTQHRAA